MVDNIYEVSSVDTQVWYMYVGSVVDNIYEVSSVDTQVCYMYVGSVVDNIYEAHKSVEKSN